MKSNIRHPVQHVLDTSEHAALASLLIEKSNDGIIVLQDGLLIFVNPAICALTGFSKKDVLGKRFVDFAHARYRKFLGSMYKRRISGGIPPSRYEIEILSKKGAYLPVEVNASLIRYGGKPAVLAILRDICERKKTEQQLKLFYEAVQSASDGVQIFDLSWRIIFSNKAAQRMYGYSQKEFEGESVGRLNSGTEVAGRAMLPPIGKCGCWRGELQATHKDGHAFPILLTLSMVKNDRGNPIAIVGVIRDITKTKQEENALHKSEEQFRRIFEQSQAGVSMVDLTGRFIKVNRRLCEILGYGEKELMRLKFSDITHPDEVSRDMGALKRMAKGEIPRYVVEKRYIRKDKSVIWCALNVSVIRDNKGNPLHFLTITEDITERKKTENALNEARINLAATQKATQVGSWVWDLKTNDFWWTDEIYSMFGIPKRIKPTFNVFMKTVVPSERKSVRAEIADALSGKKPYDLRRHILMPSGAIRTIHGRGTVEFDKAGKASKMYMTVQDVTEREEAEEEYRTVINASIDGFWISDMHGRILEVNDSYCRMSGYSRKELLDMRISDLEALESPVGVKRHILGIAKAGNGKFETRHRCRNGNILDVDLSVNYLHDSIGKFFVFVRDITEKKKAEEALLEVRERERVDQAKSQFLSIISHELRSPMTTINAQVGMLNQGYFGGLSKKQKDSMEAVMRNMDRLNGLLEDFFEINRIESAHLRFNFTRTNLMKSIRQTIDDMKGFMPEKNAPITADISQIPTIEADPDRVMQVLRNLLSNARKFAYADSRILVKAGLAGKEILFSVHNSGIAIKPQEQKHIFTPFYQAEPALYRQQSGVGLGLAICKGIVESQGGRIWFRSYPDKGTTFYFTVPLKPVKKMKPISIVFPMKRPTAPEKATRGR